jgi:hypothetical protein
MVYMKLISKAFRSVNSPREISGLAVAVVRFGQCQEADGPDFRLAFEINFI